MTQTAAQGEINVPAGENFNSLGLEGSIQQLLSENIGVYVICDFLIGTQLLERRAGILHAVGVGFLVLLDEANGNYIVCDMYSIKFVTFVDPSNGPALEGETNPA